MYYRKSTNVRTYLSPLRGPLIRAAFASAEHLAPSVGAAAAERLWFRLPATTAHARRSRTSLPAGTPFTADVGGRDVRGTSWGSGDPVYLVHGWGGWGQQLEAVVPPVVDAGLKAVVFDALSHGSSDPGRDGPSSTAVPEMVDSLRAVVALHGPARAIVAHSLGAMATAVALRDGLRADRVVFVSPAGSLYPTADYFGDLLGFGPRVKARLLARVERRILDRYQEPLARFDVPAIGDALSIQGRAPHLLVVHDRHDAETPYSAAVAINEAWDRSTLRTTSGLGHRRILRDRHVVDEVSEFVVTAPATSRPRR